MWPVSDSTMLLTPQYASISGSPGALLPCIIMQSGTSKYMAPFASRSALLPGCVIANAQAAAVQRQRLLSGNTAQCLSSDLRLEEHFSWSKQASKSLLFLIAGTGPSQQQAAGTAEGHQILLS